MWGKLLKPFFELHWSAKTVIKIGVLIADILLLSACLTMKNDYRIAYLMVQVSVYLFSESVVGGFLFDVVAKRMQM